MYNDLVQEWYFGAYEIPKKGDYVCGQTSVGYTYILRRAENEATVYISSNRVTYKYVFNLEQYWHHITDHTTRCGGDVNELWNEIVWTFEHGLTITMQKLSGFDQTYLASVEGTFPHCEAIPENLRFPLRLPFIPNRDPRALLPYMDPNGFKRMTTEEAYPVLFEALQFTTSEASSSQFGPVVERIDVIIQTETPEEERERLRREEQIKKQNEWFQKQEERQKRKQKVGKGVKVQAVKEERESEL